MKNVARKFLPTKSFVPAAERKSRNQAQPSTSDVPEPTPEPEIEQEAESVEEQTSGGFAFTTDGDIGESSTRETAREGLTKKISELETKLEADKGNQVSAAGTGRI